MDPSQHPSPVVWNVITVAMHLLSASILSVCLARRSFFHIGPKQPHPILQSSRVASSNGLDRPTLPENERRPSAETFDTLRKPIGWIRRFWRDTSLSNYTFQTTPARFATFLTLITSLLFVICSSIVVTGVGLNSNIVVLAGLDVSSNDPEPTMSCEVVIYLCVLFYGLTKICVYVVLIERVYIVSCAGSNPPRMLTRTYKAGVLGILVYIGIVILLIYGRITEVKTLTRPIPNAPTSTMVTGVCTIGLRLYSAIPLIIYETIITIVLTSIFVHPILNSEGHGYKRRLWPCRFLRNLFAPANPPKHHSHSLPNLTPKLSTDAENPIPIVAHRIAPSTTGTDDDALFHFGVPRGYGGPSSCGFELEHQDLQSKELSQLAKRCLLGSLAGLIVSFTNISVLAARNGREEGASCMRWCVADVVINALAICAVMRGREDWWWVRDASAGRPDVSLPRGIWDDTDHAAGVATTATAMRGRPVAAAEEAASEKARRRSVVFLDNSTIDNGQRSPPSVGRPHTDDCFSPPGPPPAKLLPLDSLLSLKSIQKAGCVSLQPETRRPSSTKMPPPSSSESLGRHAEKGKGKVDDEWSSSAASSSGSAIAAQGHSALATPSPLLLDAYPQPPQTTTSPTTSTSRRPNPLSNPVSPSLDRLSNIQPAQTRQPPERKRRWSDLEAPPRREL